jgi:hypothetical protein
MPNEAIERTVDDLIAKGRIPKDMRDTYVRDLENGFGAELLRGADYTKKTQQLANEKRQYEQWVEQERQKVQAERERLSQWQQRAEGELGRMPELTARLAAAEQALRDYKIYEEVNLPPIGAAPAQSRQTFQPQQTQQMNGLSREEAASYIRDLTILQGKVNKINAQHMRLFGEPLDDDLVTHYLTTGEDPEQHWRVKYAVENRQAEMQTKKREAEYASMKEQMRSELMQEMALDPSRITGTPSPTFGRQTPLMEQYTHSRATAHSQNHANDNPAPKADEYVPPEKRPELQASRDRIASASRMYLDNFDQVGNPTSNRGQELFKKYGSA